MTGTDIAMSVIVTILSVAGIVVAFWIAALYTVIFLSELYYWHTGEVDFSEEHPFFTHVIMMVVLDMAAYWIITHLWGVIKTIGLFLFG